MRAHSAAAPLQNAVDLSPPGSGSPRPLASHPVQPAANQARWALRGRKSSSTRDWEKILPQAMSSGEFRPDLDVKVVSYGLLGLLNWAYRWYKPGGRLGFREVADHSTKPVVAGGCCRFTQQSSQANARIERAFRTQRIAETFQTR